MRVTQAEDANYLQKALSGRAKNFQVIEAENGQVRVENVVQLGPLLSIKAGGTCSQQGSTRTLVTLDDVRAELGPLRWAAVFSNYVFADLSWCSDSNAEWYQPAVFQKSWLCQQAAALHASCPCSSSLS